MSDFKQFLSTFEYFDALLVTLKYNISVWCNFIYYCDFFSIWSSEAVFFSSHTRWSSCTKVLFTFHRTVQLFHYILWFSVKRLTQELLVPWQKKRILTAPFVFEIFWLPCIQSCNKHMNFCGTVFNYKSKIHLPYNYFFF